MKIERYSIGSTVYKAYSAREVKQMFRAWKKDLTKAEKKAFANYRRRLYNKNNINEKL